jgi:Fe-S-cluster-containing hydrogenase component 2
MKKIFIDAFKCSGCRYCELVCSFFHEGKFNPKLSRIRIFKEDEYGIDNPILCSLCSYCSCINICPTNAFYKNDKGFMEINIEKCIKCYKCIESCFFGAVFLHLEKNIPIVCNLCNGDPKCVKKCPTGAIIFTEPNNFTQIKNYEYSRIVYQDFLNKHGMKIKSE